MKSTTEEFAAHLMAHIISLSAGHVALEKIFAYLAHRSGVSEYNGRPLADAYRVLHNDALQRMLLDIEKASPAFAARVADRMSGINNGAGPFPSWS